MADKLDPRQKKELVEYLLENRIDRSIKKPYDEVAAKFGFTSEQVRRIYRTLRKVNFVENTNDLFEKRETEENVKSETRTITAITKRNISTLSELIEVCEIDLDYWNIDRWVCNQWQVGAKNAAQKIEVTPLFQVKAFLSVRKLDFDLEKQKEVLLEELKKYSPVVGSYTPAYSKFGSHLLEICIPDLHIGKHAWSRETGEDYDLEIAENRVKEAIEDLLSRVNLSEVDRILFPVGNDLINVDNRNNTTTAGTPQDSDSRYLKIVKATKRILVDIIDRLSNIALVDVIVVPGNHDQTTTFLMGEILDAFYHNNEKVFVDNEPKLRKYYSFGMNSFQLTHGDQEPHTSLGLIFATEMPQLWADTKYRFAQLGHYHKNKKLNYVSVDEHQGFQVQILPSLSGRDAWHAGKGYHSLKQAKAFLFDAEKGGIAEYTYNVSV